MASSAHVYQANALADAGKILADFLRSDGDALRLTHVDWKAKSLLSAPTEVVLLLNRLQALTTTNTLTPPGLRLLGQLQLDLEAVVANSPLSEAFDDISVLARGSNSVTFKAISRQVGRTVVLKILRPGVSEISDEAIRRLGQLENVARLVAPIDATRILATTSSGDPVRLTCIVYPFITAITLHDYLRDAPPLSPYFFEAFIRQVGGVLAELEAMGLRHGDLHARNILVKAEEPALEFTIIDPSPELGEHSSFAGPASDLDWFKEHIATALLILQRHLPTISTPKHLGPRLLSLINQVQRSEELAFRDVLRLIEADPFYERWARDRDAFVAAKFNAPPPLGLLRWEEIADPARAVELFEPYPELFRRIRTFGNSLLVGARGSGKSTYLAALAYFPGAAKRQVDPKDIFGILFSCRQGEFKQLSGAPETTALVKHVLVLKIIRRMLALLAAGVEARELDLPSDLGPLHDFVDEFIAPHARIPRVNISALAAIRNVASGVARWQSLEVRQLFSGQSSVARPLLGEHSLLTLCETLRRLCRQLPTTQFYLLFDDAGVPNLSSATQRVLNDLLTSSNSLYCVKLSAERFSYVLRDSLDRSLEETHDFTSFDIASVYSSEAGFDASRTEIRQYFFNIIKRRLHHWNYPTDDITDYVGDQHRQPEKVIQVRELIRRLAEDRKDAYYSGWDVIWQLADKTARNLIELVSEIFAHARVRPKDETGGASQEQPPTVIKPRLQDRAVRAVSTRRLRGLEFTAGEVSLRGQAVPLGKHLYLCATSFGSVSRRYLRASANSDRHDERLAIERNDTATLPPDAEEVLRLLVRYGVFDDSSLNVAFDDGQKKPVYVFNRIFTPAFAISFRRDAHLRLSAGRLAQYLLEPAAFSQGGTKFLRSPGDHPALWDNESD